MKKKQLLGPFAGQDAQNRSAQLFSTLQCPIVFVPVPAADGRGTEFLLAPLAMAVFAMLTSYLLTRTLVPTMVHYMLPPEVEMPAWRARARGAGGQDPRRVHHAFNRRFEAMRVTGGL